MTTAKTVILTAIKYKGIKEVKAEAAQLAEDIICSKSYVRSIIRKIEKGQIIIK